MNMNSAAASAGRLAAARATDEIPADFELAVAAQSDPDAFLCLYERYFGRISGYVALRIADRAACEDVTSHVFMTALAKISSFRGRGPFAAWLFRIASNAVRDEQRRWRPANLSQEALEGIVAPQASTEQLVLARELGSRLRAAVAELPQDEQHLLALRYGAELGFQEVATILRIQPGAARMRAHRTLTDLRRRLPDDTR